MGRQEPTGGAQRPSSLPALSGKTPAAGCGGRARAGPAHPGRWDWPQAGLRVLGQVLVVGSVWPFSPQGWPGHHAPAAGGQGPHSHLLPTGDRSCLTCPPAVGPLEWQGHPYPWGRCQERRGQGGAPGAPRRLEAPAALGQGPTGDSEKMVGLRPGLCRWAPRGAPAPPGSCLCRAAAVTPAWGLQMSRKLCLQVGGPRGPSSLRTEGLWGRSLEPRSSPPQSPRHPCSQTPPTGGLGKSPSRTDHCSHRLGCPRPVPRVTAAPPSQLAPSSGECRSQPA